MKKSDLRLMALSAPHWERKVANESVSLNSRSPFSIQNAVRLAADKALHGEGVLGASNWSSKDGLRESVFLMEYWEDEKAGLEQKLREEKPNILFVGAMTQSFPGAIEVARLAKDVLGEDVFVVLGGKHANETFFDGKKIGICNAAGSPLRLMEEGKIPKVFDLVCSGPSEELIAALAERIGELVAGGKPLKEVYSEISEFTKTVKGDWRAGWIEGDAKQQVQSDKIPIDYSEMPVPAEIFGIKGNFAVYGTELTAHAFSDTSPGCVYDCFFCSERFTNNGPLQDKNHAADRLVRQLKAIRQVAEGENHTDSVSVFVEDSTLLNTGKSPAQLQRLAELLRNEEHRIAFGGQFTVDQLLNPDIQQAIRELQPLGLSYIFAGMETRDEEVAKSMAKNVKKSESWTDRNEKAIAFLHEVDIRCGVAVLFGLGESQETRMRQLEQLQSWQKEYGEPLVVSLNLAAVHPLQEGAQQEDFTEWGTPKDSQYLEIFQRLFGEASERYAVDKEHLPTTAELAELEAEYWKLELRQEVRKELHEENNEPNPEPPSMDRR